LIPSRPCRLVLEGGAPIASEDAMTAIAGEPRYLL
jgi:hypothetical protein